MLKIAICDDNEIQLTNHPGRIRKKNIKEKTSYTIDKFNSDAAFSRILQSGNCPYDIIFMDIVLGDSSASGIDLVHKVNLLNPSSDHLYQQYLEFASDVYDTQHVYFVNKERLSEFLGKAWILQ